MILKLGEGENVFGGVGAGTCLFIERFIDLCVKNNQVGTKIGKK